MSKILAVFGATGKQGSSVVNHVLSDDELSKRYKIRAITRDVNSAAAKKLTEQADVVQADVSDRSSIETALIGVHTVFAMTIPVLGPGGEDAEYNHAKTIADVAVARGIDYLIFSTLPSVNDFSGGKLSRVTPFEAKARAEKYIKTLPIKSAFYCPGFFVENFFTPGHFMQPQEGPDGTSVLALPVSPGKEIPLLDSTADTGKFVGAILAAPDKYQGKTFFAAEGVYTLEETVARLSKATGKPWVYQQVSPEAYVEVVKKMLPNDYGIIVDACGALEDFGYMGPDTPAKVSWAVENARGKLSDPFESRDIVRANVGTKGAF